MMAAVSRGKGRIISVRRMRSTSCSGSFEASRSEGSSGHEMDISNGPNVDAWLAGESGNSCIPPVISLGETTDNRSFTAISDSWQSFEMQRCTRTSSIAGDDSMVLGVEWTLIWSAAMAIISSVISLLGNSVQPRWLEAFYCGPFCHHLGVFPPLMET